MALPAPVESPKGRVKLGVKHTLVAGGLSNLLVGDHRAQLVHTLDEVSCVAGTVLYAASRLLLLYATEKLVEGSSFPPTGLTSSSSFGHKENMKWRGTASVSPPGEAPVVFTQELVGWATQLFKKERRTHKTTKDDVAYQDLQRLVDQNGLVADLGGLQDTAQMTSILHSLTKSFAVVISNHLTVATAAHTKLYLKAKYAHLHLSNKEATQLSKTIGRSVQWNNKRTQLNKGKPYDTLPPHRKEKQSFRFGEKVTIPEVDPMEWREIVDAERALLPATWTQVDMLRGRFRMLSTILNRSTAEKPLKAFTLLPQCRSGRVFLKMNTESITDMFKRAKLPTDRGVLDIFDQRKLQRLMRHPLRRSEQTVELQLAGEFFRTDGVQAQFVCGTPPRKKRDRIGNAKDSGVEDDEGAAAVDDGADDVCDEDEDIVSPAAPQPLDFEHLFAVDPGRTNLYTAVKARRVDEAERTEKFPDLAPLGDGTYVVWEKVSLPAKRRGKYNNEYLTKGAKQYDEECGGRMRRQKRVWRVQSVREYRLALARLSEATLACVDMTQMKSRIKVHFQCHAAIHSVEGSRDVAKDRFDAYIRKQQTLGSIARDFKEVLGDKGICAWGGARWAVGMKGAAPCRSAMVFKYLKRQSFGNRIFAEAETNTSRKNAISLRMEAMIHPYHRRFAVHRKRSCFQTSFDDDGITVIDSVNIGTHRVGVPGGGRPHGLYLETEGMKRTCSRDTNGASNIWRCYWERCHGRPRPETLRSKKYLGDNSGEGAGRSACNVPCGVSDLESE